MKGDDPRTDAEIVAAVVAGDTDSFAVLVARHQRRVFNVALRMTGNRVDAEDLAQEIFCKLFQNLERYDPALPLENWLVRISTNHTLNWLGRKRITTLPLEHGGSDGTTSVDPAGDGPSPAEHAERAEMKEIVLEALQRLPANLRLVFVLKYMEDYTADEVAEMVDVPRNTAKTWIFRAREALRAELGWLLGEPEGRRR
jgi:RNA polymerase sigma-70 factor (ECF subfamily)